MPRERLAEALLWLAIVLSGVVFGASVYQRVSLIPEWGGNLPDSVGDYFKGTNQAGASARFWRGALPPTGLCILVTLIAAWPDRGRRTWIAIALGLYVVALVWTAVYFIPKGVVPLMEEAGQNLTPAQITATAEAWIFWDWLRMALTLGFLLALMKALTLRGTHGASG